MSYLICSMSLVALIAIMPYLYSVERDNIEVEISTAQLTEIADYTSNTLENLYFLANSTNNNNVDLTKKLLYLPLTVQDSFYTLKISSVGNNASRVVASLKDRPSISGESWLVPGLKTAGNFSLERDGREIIAGCYRNATDSLFYVSLEYGVEG